MLIRKISFFLAIFFLLLSSSSFARDLYWKRLEVSAHLDAAGTLDVTERQYMVFNGAWNGGERDFRTGFRQRLDFLGMDRIEPGSGKHVHLRPGDLSTVDEYKFVDRNTLRWRSRLPSDPAFKHRTLIYELHYRISNVLKHEGKDYLLDHDFAFPKRNGVIQHFTLDLDFDPVWSGSGSHSVHLERGPIPPGQSVVLRFPLRYVGEGLPSGQLTSSPLLGRLLLVVALLGFILWRSIVYVRHEIANGKYLPLPDLDRIDEAWLKSHVLNQLPEKIGNLWDAHTGSAEVAAILARMTQEGKLESHVETRGFWPLRRPVLYMTLNVEQTSLKTYEASLVKALFFGNKKTDTHTIRKHYKKTGFDPAAKVRRWLPDSERVSTANKKTLHHTWIWTALLFVAGACLVVLNTIYELELLLIVSLPFSIGLLVLTFINMVYTGPTLRMEVEAPIKQAIWNLLAYGFYAVPLTVLLLLDPLKLPFSLFVGFVLWAAMLYNNLINQSLTRVTAHNISLRKELSAARRYFMRELASPAPNIRDEWFPYLIAFGLDSRMQRWFKRYGYATSSTSYSDYNGSSSGGWTGGGGSFGGGGATGSWSDAAGAVASGVSAPSSGGSGGGGSSGGGGGGGW